MLNILSLISICLSSALHSSSFYLPNCPRLMPFSNWSIKIHFNALAFLFFLIFALASPSSKGKRGKVTLF